MGYERRDNKTPQLTDHCFTGDYPIEVKDRENYIKESKKTLKQYNY